MFSSPPGSVGGTAGTGLKMCTAKPLAQGQAGCRQAIGLSEAKAAEAIPAHAGVTMAASDGPSRVTLAGSCDAIAKIG